MSNDLTRRDMVKTLSVAGLAGAAGCYTQQDGGSDTVAMMPVKEMTKGKQKEIPIVRSKSELDEPDQTPMIAYSLKEGWIYYE